jgi:hypothetical protein
VPLHVGLLGRDVEAAVSELADSRVVGLYQRLWVHASIGFPLDQRWCITGGEEVDAIVVGEEKLTGVWKAAADGKVRPPAAAL